MNALVESLGNSIASFPPPMLMLRVHRLQPFLRLEGSYAVGPRGGSGRTMAFQQPPVDS
jgi:hypothetical protein